MPYIDNRNHRRHQIAPRPQQPARDVGELTYQIQQLIAEYIDTQQNSYGLYASVLGALEGAKYDFVDRVLLPHERLKRAQNGDVWGWPFNSTEE